METRVYGERREVAVSLAGEIAGLIRERNGQGRPTVLGLATGRTPIGVYAELARLHREEGLDFAGVEAFNLDEFEGVGPDHPGSFSRFLHEHLFDHVNIEAHRVHMLSSDAMHPSVAGDYETQIRDKGGIDLQILGVGMNGHVGFNEPGSASDSRTRRVELHEATRAAYAQAQGGRTPTHALTMGVATIMEARSLRLIALGSEKAGIIEALLHGPQHPELPASLLREHPDLRLLMDEGAASQAIAEDPA